MILSYKGTALDDNEVWFQIIKQWHRAQTGIITHRTERWNTMAVVTASSQSALETKINTRESLFKSGHGDLIWYQSDGTTETEHKIKDTQTTNGVRVVSFNWLDGPPGQWGGHTEYTQVRTYRVVFEADVIDAEGDIVFWSQTLEQIGTGGADFEVQESLNAPPIVQFTNAGTAYRMRQHGMAIGLLGTPPPAAPLWPGSLKPRESRPLMQSDPKQWGINQSIYWPQRWDYWYLAAQSLQGVLPPIIV